MTLWERVTRLGLEMRSVPLLHHVLPFPAEYRKTTMETHAHDMLRT